jgi:hypothetical protein
MSRHTPDGRGWAYTGAILGGLVSIAANVAHSFVPPAGAANGWTPELGAVFGAIVWPVFLFIAVEILARVAWPHGRIWHAVRWAGVLPVALVAALVSYRHLSGLLAHYGEEDLVVWLGPLAVDGLMVMATGALMATSRHRTTSTDPEPVPVGRPDAVSTAAPEPTPIPAPSTVNTADPSVPDAAPAPSTPDPIPSSTVDTDPEPVPVPVAAPIPSPAEVAPRITPARPSSTPTPSAAVSRPARPARRPRPSTRPVPAAELAPSTTDNRVSASDAAQHGKPVPADLLARATHVARQYRTEHGTPITPGQLAVRLKVTSEQAAQALAVIGLNPNQTTNPTVPTPTVNGRPVQAAR